VRRIPEYSAVEWVVRFENGGNADTPIIENALALDGAFPAGQSAVVLDQIEGDQTNRSSFMPVERAVAPGDTIVLAPSDGRPSSGTFPMWNLQIGDAGFFTAIGWTGRWSAAISRAADGSLHVTAGMERTHLVLHPGESIRTPRILLMSWKGDREEAHNKFRRLLLAGYYPRIDDRLIHPAIGAQFFNSWAGGRRPEWGTEEGQIEAARINKRIGGDTLWMDAGWFEGYFPNGAGNWRPRAKDFPRGLRPVGDECRRLGMRFLMWYEPERVCANTEIATDHPEFVLGGAAGGLFNLGNPDAWRWMADRLNGQIAEYGLSCWRSDFNMDPLPYWRNNDAPDRQGITEIRYVEGLYRLWDDILARHPGIYIDMCASGGRRIDLETVMRSVVQTRSDTECAPGRAEWDQSQASGLSRFVPIACSFGWETGSYDVRSTATMGYLGEFDLLDPAFPAEQVRACFDEVRENQPYWYGDFYPLTPWTNAPDAWVAWQFNRPDLEGGIALAFRRQTCPTPSISLRLRGLRAHSLYDVTLIDDAHVGTTKRMTTEQMRNLTVEAPAPRASVLVRYRLRRSE
jgi:alpha-galactosidase